MRKLVLVLVALAVPFVAGVPTASAAQTSVTINGGGCPGGATFCFSPASITVHDGDTIIWTNQTAVPHTVTRCTANACSGTTGGTGADAAFTTANINAGNGTFSHTFRGAGTYLYYCQIHGFAAMQGTITVTAPPTLPTPPMPPRPTATAPRATGTTPRVAAIRALPHTGAPTSALALLASVFLLVGVLAARTNRRRTHTQGTHSE